MVNNKDLPNNKTWIKVIKQDSIFFQSTLLLKNGFKHAFFTKKVSRNSPQDLVKLISRDPSIHLLEQVHSNKVIHASEINGEKVIKADSIISDKESQSLWIYSADCIPILIGDSKTGRAVAIHSGWKGLVKSILKKTINQIEIDGCHRKNIIIAIGPAISGINYQVEEEIVFKVYKTLNNIKNIHNENIIKYMQSINCIKLDKNPNKYLLDIRNVAKEQFLLEGIDPNHISLNSNCTFGEKELFYSWRRDHCKSRQFSVIESRISNKNILKNVGNEFNY